MHIRLREEGLLGSSCELGRFTPRSIGYIIPWLWLCDEICVDHMHVNNNQRKGMKHCPRSTLPDNELSESVAMHTGFWNSEAAALISQTILV